MSWTLLLVLAVGCGRVSDWGTPRNPGAMLPHPQGWEEAAGHGHEYLARGVGSCDGCHETEPGNEFCGECHASYPHAESWIDGSAHGEGTYGKGGKLQPCQDCHALEGSAAGALSCTGCHSSYPHPDGWELGGEHGAYLVARGSLMVACTPCHGESLDGGRVSEACDSCHASYPHPEGWESGERHGRFDNTQRPGVGPRGCQGCHGDASGGAAGVSCSRCHASYPHGAGWVRTHSARVGALGEGVCAPCHAAGDGPASVPSTCAPSCHGGVE